MQDLMIKCYLAAHHLYKSGITLKGDQYIMFIFMGKLPPWRWNDLVKTRPGSTCIGFHPENMLSLTGHQTSQESIRKLTCVDKSAWLHYCEVQKGGWCNWWVKSSVKKKSHRKLFILSFDTSSLWKCVLEKKYEKAQNCSFKLHCQCHATHPEIREPPKELS